MTRDQLVAELARATAHYDADTRYHAFDGTFRSFIRGDGLKPALLDSAGDEKVRANLVDDLADEGLVRIFPSRGTGVERTFALTSEGRRYAAALDAQPSQTDAVDLSWPILSARLFSFVEAYELAGAPLQGIPFDEASGEAAHIRTLVRSGHLEETEFSFDQQTLLRPTERAFIETRAWPSALSEARDIVDEVVIALEADPGPRAAPLKAALTAGGRDVLIEVIAAVLAKQSGGA